MTPDLDALAALLAAATPGPIEGCECACHGIDTIADICRHCGPYQEAATLQVAAVNALPSLIEAARREAGLRANLAQLLAAYHGFAHDGDPRTNLSSDITAASRCSSAICGATAGLLHDNAGASERGAE